MSNSWNDVHQLKGAQSRIINKKIPVRPLATGTHSNENPFLRVPGPMYFGASIFLNHFPLLPFTRTPLPLHDGHFLNHFFIGSSFFGRKSVPEPLQ